MLSFRANDSFDYANLLHLNLKYTVRLSYITTDKFDKFEGTKPELYRRYIDDCFGATSCSRQELDYFITSVNSFHPALKYTWVVSECLLLFKILTFRSVATDSQLACTTNPQTHIAFYCTHHPTQHTSRTPSLTRNSLDCDVFVATTLISLRKQRKCASSSRHAVIPIQLSTTANTAHSQSIRNRHHFRHTTNKREESHSHSHFTHITYQSKTSS